MGLVDGKRALIVGVANERSIAWGIAQALHAEGAELGFTYVNEAIEKRLRPLVAPLGTALITQCDVASDESIASAVDAIKTRWDRIDILVHSVAFALRDELNGSFLKTTREGFRIAMDTSVYSLVALVKATSDLLSEQAAVLTLTYHGSTQVVPNYNVQGPVKAALEASVRYLAADLGPRGIRVNAISAGPIRTLAASGIAGIRDMIAAQKELAPLRRNVTIEDVGKSALWLCSDFGSGITGEIVYVDAGAHIMHAPPESQ